MLKCIFGAERWNKSLLHLLCELTWCWSTSGNSAPQKTHKTGLSFSQYPYFSNLDDILTYRLPTVYKTSDGLSL